ncbi:uncharacterized protein LOC131428882 [Malaya genurostris]|uniref:uncharacterized protein LOC131428882 n=1 Tax=Malaya genurostris TaxID=325434 RepID=UPI0026F37ECC|nr:uncharacterized protein LOC131428882 [Malaya genurostris]
MMEGHHDTTGFNCKRCNLPDSADNHMVACDKCHGWEHFKCAGVDEKIKDKPYSCRKCSVQENSTLLKPTAEKKGASKGASSKAASKRSKKPVPADPAPSVTSSVRAAMELELKLIEEECQLREKELNEQEELQKLKLEEEQRQLEEQRELLKKEAALRERKLQEAAIIKAKQQLIRQKSIEKKRELMQRLGSSSSQMDAELGSAKLVENLLRGLPPTDESANSSVSGNERSRLDSLLVPEDKPESVEPTVPSSDAVVSTPAAVFSSAASADCASAFVVPPKRNEQTTDGIVYTPGKAELQSGNKFYVSPQQIAARQVIGKDLPAFGGNPEEWPAFISCFDQTTAACGYTNIENLNRLQRALYGHAKDTVRNQLFLPECVPHVIKSLEKMYGRPELLIRTLLEKIRGLQPPKHEKLETLMEFGIAVRYFVGHLKAARQDAHLTNPSLMQELVEKLPGQLKLDWAIFKSQYQTVTLTTFGEFTDKLVDAATEVTYDLPCFRRPPKTEKQKVKEKVFVQAHSTDSSAIRDSKQQHGKTCAMCNLQGHRIIECHRFKSLCVSERVNVIQQKGLCKTCLNNHGKWPCKSWKGCAVEGCRERHNTLLHPAPSVNVSASHVGKGAQQIPLFRIIPVVLFGKDRSQTVFAFIDEGSSITLLEESVANQLGIAGKPEPLTLQWTGNMTRVEQNSQQVKMEITSKQNELRRRSFHARTVSCLVLPSQSMCYRELSQQFPHLRGLPMEDYELVQPKLLIGLDNLSLTVPLKLREGKNSEPVAVKCRLGWSIYGCGSSKPIQRSVVNLHVSASPDPDRLLNDQLREYFAVENTGIAIPIEKLESKEENRARRILTETTRRTGNRFETGLLWRSDEPNFPDSFPMAIRRLRTLERKLQNDPAMSKRVSSQIAEYLQKGYAHKASEEELRGVDAKRIWYLPLGIVINPKKPSKVRLVWDASAKVEGVSFNSSLLKGPDLLTPLPKVLSRFRQFPVAVSGDIREMFHQIKIRHPDSQSLRFLWRDSPSDNPTVYIMDVCTFGSTCSPTSAQHVKNTNAREYEKKFPRACEVILNSHYVDDLLESFRTVKEAIDVINDVKTVHSLGGFELRNFLSNKVEVLQGIGEISASATKDLLLERESTTESVLGMRWIPSEDMFTYTFVPRSDLQSILADGYIPTKREVLKVVMSLFDPLGLLAIFLVHGKVLIQDCWAAGLAWDDPINEDLCERWRRWTKFFPSLDTLRIPRCYFRSPPTDDTSSLQLHVFVDASEVACSCVAYFRLQIRSDIQIALVAAKTKIAPLKTLSIPKLELKAAVLGVRLLEFVQNSHSYSIKERFLWSDSSTVLAWIQSDHRRYPKFVAVRVGEILMASDQREWRWLPSKMNIADAATKWKSDPDLGHTSSWFAGPNFLREKEETWPGQRRFTTTLAEVKASMVHTTFDPMLDVTRFGSWTKLLRTTAYVLRFIGNLRRKKARIALEMHIFTQEELKKVEEILWKLAQQESFSTEVHVLRSTQGPPEARHAVVAKSSPLYGMWPFMDKKGVVRKRGKIGAAPFAPFEAKFPVILPKQHLISSLIVDWYHRRFRHANRETIVNEMRQRFEIPRLRELIKRVTNNCVWCRVAKATPKPPPMASLPAIRLTPFVKFSFVGLDYFGPVLVKVGRNQVKRWVALFTCLTVRAVHLEVVYSLTTEACIMAVRRFISRRGPPAEFHSDNGTCFVGANNILKREIEMRNQALAETFTNAETRWRFTPPATPHMGGVWERLVRSVKTAIGALLDAPRKPDDETLLTILCEAEMMINSRPLTYVPLESAEQEALTPNHFLLGSSNGKKVLPIVPVDRGETLRSSWNLARHLCDEFWKRWVKEYLPVITRRCKWFDEVKDIAVGDLVVVVSGTARNQWVRGRVIDVVPGQDGRVRQAWVQTPTGVLKRAVVNLAVLDVMKKGKSESSEENHHQDLRAGDCDGGPSVTSSLGDCSK